MNDHNHDENCGCEDEEQIFVVTDNEGVDHEMVIVYTFEFQEQAYAVLLDRNDTEADGIIFRVEENEESTYLVGIEDDEEWDRVVAIYNEIAEQEKEHELEHNHKQ